MTNGPIDSSGIAGSDLARALPASFNFASLIVGSSSLVSIFEGASHRCIFSNEAHDAVFGPPEEAGATLRQAWPDLAEQAADQFDHVYSFGETCTLPAVRKIITDDNGKQQTRWYRQTLQPWRGSEGRISGVVSHAQDFTDQIKSKEALTKRIAELELALEVAGGVGSWDWDVAADRLTVNDRFAAFFGLPTDQAQGLPIDRFVQAILEEDRGRIEAAIASAIADGGDYLQDYRVRSIGGDVRWVTARGRCFRDEEGNPTRFPGVVFDITRQMEERQQGEQTFALLQSFLDNSASYVFAKDLEGRYILANQFYLNTFGETETTLYGRTDRDRFGEDERYSINDRRVAESGNAIEFEEEAVRADGEAVNAISVKFPLRDSKGVLFGTGSISTDVTERRRTEAALAESEERRMRAMRAGLVGTFEYYPEQGRFECDNMTAEMIGLTNDHPGFADLADALHDDDKAKLEESRVQVQNLAPGARPTLEFRLAGEHPWTRWIAITGMLEQAEGSPSIFIGTVRDITERKNYEDRLRYLNRELSHRVKNLFAVTRSMIRMTARQEPAAAAFADKAVERIDALAAAHSVGLASDGANPVDLHELLAAILHAFSHNSSEQVRFEGQPISVSQLMITPLTLVIYEMATNAFKYGCLAHPDGRLVIEWSATESGADPLCIEMRWREHCFEAVSYDEERKKGGFGHRLIDASVKQMGGTHRTEWLQTGLATTFVIPLAVDG